MWTAWDPIAMPNTLRRWYSSRTKVQSRVHFTTGFCS
uniref:Uncharacterized protein n=1 Tax=Anguilla anguilla TaxID=7936 RepID=A0A0E9RSA5_ANGAN